MNKKFTLDRRYFLKTMGLGALSLPFLGALDLAAAAD